MASLTTSGSIVYSESVSTGTTEASLYAIGTTTGVDGLLTPFKSFITPLATTLIPVSTFVGGPTTISTSGSPSSTSGSPSSTSGSPSSTSGSLSSTTTTSGPPAAKSTVFVTVPKKETATVVGAAVGCLIGGALIAALLTWLIMGSRQKKKNRSSGGGFGRDRHHSSRPSNEKALPTAPLLGAAAIGNWEKHLDQPESDNTITRSVKGLFDHIEVHVENFYRDARVPITHELQQALMAVEGSRDLPDSVAGLLPLTDRPTMLIKHCIAHAIVQHISSESDIPDSFLPIDFIALPQVLNTGTRRTTANKPAYNQAYARWRVLSAYLRPKPAEDTTYTRTRDTHIAALADKLCRTFEPWALSKENFASRRENLVNIMKAGAETGVLIFSQPSSFQWLWRVGSGSGNGKGGRVAVVLLPGLEKVRDEEARELERRVLVLRPVEGVIVGTDEVVLGTWRD